MDIKLKELIITLGSFALLLNIFICSGTGLAKYAMVKGYYTSVCKSVWKRFNVELNFEDEDLEIIKNGKVDFISFSYYFSYLVSDDGNGGYNYEKGNGKAIKLFFENYDKDLQKLLIAPFDINLGYSV